MILPLLQVLGRPLFLLQLFINLLLPHPLQVPPVQEIDTMIYSFFLPLFIIFFFVNVNILNKILNFSVVVAFAASINDFLNMPSFFFLKNPNKTRTFFFFNEIVVYDHFSKLAIKIFLLDKHNVFYQDQRQNPLGCYYSYITFFVFFPLLPVFDAALQTPRLLNSVNQKKWMVFNSIIWAAWRLFLCNIDI